MDLTIKGWNGVKDTVELGEDDTPAVLRRKVASAVGLPEDGFVMSFGGVAMDEGYDMTQLSAGDTVVLTKVTKYEARAALHALGETDITAERLKSIFAVHGRTGLVSFFRENPRAARSWTSTLCF